MPIERVLRLQRSWHYYRTGEGVELASMLQGKRLRLKGHPESLWSLLEALADGVPAGRATADLARRTNLPKRAVRRFVDELRQRGALVEASPSAAPSPDDLYRRQRQFFDMFETNGMSGEVFNRRLQQRKVLVVGLGGYGTWLVLLAARIGIRHIIGIDGDRVDRSNLSRQVLYDAADVGRLKVEACADTLCRVDPEVRFEGVARWLRSPEELLPYLAGVDLVFNAFGYLPNPSLDLVATACGRAGVPSLLLGGSWVGPLTVPGVTACPACVASNPQLAGPINASMARFVTGTPSDRALGGVFAPRIAVTAGLAVWEASRYLSGIDRTPALDGVIALDLMDYRRSRLIRVERNPQCAKCSAWNTTTGKEDVGSDLQVG